MYKHSRNLNTISNIPLWGIVDVCKSVSAFYIPRRKKTIFIPKNKVFYKNICIYIKYIFVKYIFKHFKICKINIFGISGKNTHLYLSWGFERYKWVKTHLTLIQKIKIFTRFKKWVTVHLRGIIFKNINWGYFIFVSIIFKNINWGYFIFVSSILEMYPGHLHMCVFEMHY